MTGLKEYMVEFTESENNYTFTGEWYQEMTEAESEIEAIEFIKQYLLENEEEPENFIYRIKEA